MIRIAVIHRELLAAQGIAAALGVHPHLLPVGVADSARGAEVVTANADAVVLDDRLAGSRTLERRLRRLGARLVLIGDDPADRAAGEDEGIRVHPSASIETLAAALAPQVVPASASTLTDQQRRVLTLASRGLTARQIAREMGISPKTVEQHKSRIFQKLGVPNQAAAVRVALTVGLEGSVA